ncbi:MFS transporter [Streptomyces spiralis]|uniref:MFS transporter n=1 Tax=Streptomyces spiralis TaxID=66376 RepID=UPI0033CAAB30
MSQRTVIPPNNQPPGDGSGSGPQTEAIGSSRSTTSWVFVLTALTLLSEEAAYAYNLVTPALPSMAVALHTDQIAWVTTLFTLVGGVTAPLVGKIADMYGKKRVLLATTGVMVFGSLIVASASSFAIVLLGRGLEGTAVAILPLTYSLMRDILPKRLLPVGISIAASGLGLTGILAPIIAGALIDHFTYRGVFYFLVAFPMLLGLLVWAFVPESQVRARGRLNWRSALQLGAGIALILIGLSQAKAWHGGAPGYTVGGGVLVLVGWAWYEQRLTEPFIDLSLLRTRAVLTTAVTQLTAQGAIALNLTLLSFMVQVPRSLGHAYGFGESASGLAKYTAPAGLISMLMGFAVGFIVRRRGARMPLWMAFVAAGTGSLLIGTWHDQPWQVMLSFFVYAIGGGTLQAAIPNQVVAAVPPDNQAVSAGMVNLIGSIGTSVFVQIGFAILTAHIGMVAHGQPIYTGTGFVLAYYLTAAVCVVGLVAALLMRHGTAKVGA